MGVQAIQRTFSTAGARSSPTPAPACSVRFRALIAAEWYQGVRIRRCDRLVGAAPESRRGVIEVRIGAGRFASRIAVGASVGVIG